jgi:hypothetical protein
VVALLRQTLKTKPKAGTHWTCRSMAAEAGVSYTTVHRICRAFGLQPHRQKHFKLSTDPFFVEKVRDIVGLYLNPPDKAVVLCVDEKSQVQALDRTQPVLPLGLGYVEGVTHDYVRHGTTTLFATLDIASGQVLTKCKPRHRHQERQVQRPEIHFLTIIFCLETIFNNLAKLLPLVPLLRRGFDRGLQDLKALLAHGYIFRGSTIGNGSQIKIIIFLAFSFD